MKVFPRKITKRLRRLTGQLDAVKVPTTRGACHPGQHDSQEKPRPDSVRNGRVRACAQEHGAGTMTRKRGDDQHGYDPKRSTARSWFDHMEQQAEQRPDKPAQQIGAALKVPKITPTTK